MRDNNDNDDRTIYCGNLSEKATEQILYELFFQVGKCSFAHLFVLILNKNCMF